MSQYYEGEFELIRLKPHPFAFSKFSLLWVYFVLISLVSWLILRENPAFLNNELQNVTGNSNLYLIWAGLVLIPMLIISLINLKPGFVFWGVIMVVGGLLINNNSQALQESWTGIISAELMQPLWKQIGLPVIEAPFFLFVYTFICANLGYLFLEIYRLSHVYIVTNQRIIARVGLFRKLVRDIMYSHIEEFLIHRGFLGRMFNFGSIIPFGEKIQQNIYLPAGETKTTKRRKKFNIGDKTIVLPKNASFFVVWQVSDPEKSCDLIEQTLNRTGNKSTKKIKFSQPEQEETVIRKISK